ncbi:MAG: hypothetical protein ACOZCL_02130 [Bacillota bacterium]
MAPAVKKFLNSLKEQNVDQTIIEHILKGYEDIKDSSKKPRKADFFINAMKVMDELLDYETRYKVRDSCACCLGGWREKAVRKVEKEYSNRSIQEIITALNQIEHMGYPILNDDGTITAGIGGIDGCGCACATFTGAGVEQPDVPVSSTYCLCCAGHFRYYYQIALNKKLRTKEILSTSLESCGKSPCRFVYEIIK